MTDVARSRTVTGVLLALGSAVSFGLTTPLVARFGAGVGALWIAALLYVGAAVLALVGRLLAKDSGRALSRADAPRLLLVALFGAALAPTLLAWGLARAGATTSSLLLNFEAVLTVLLARWIYREPFAGRAGWALGWMSLGGCAIALDAAGLGGHGRAELWGFIAVLGATASWAMDNTLTRGLAERAPLDVVAAKGTLGAVVTLTLAKVLGQPAPNGTQAAVLLLCGATGYGLSLCLYLLAQRQVGAGRTGSVFALGPFVGAALGWLLGDRSAGAGTFFGAAAFGIGVYLHLTERHGHRHVHEPLSHEHAHRHDDGHHEHRHEPPVFGEHTHEHRHERLEHDHEHAPDVHHSHGHSRG